MKIIKLPILWLSPQGAELEALGIEYSGEPDIKEVYFTSIDHFYENDEGVVISSGGEQFQTTLTINQFINKYNNEL